MAELTLPDFLKLLNRLNAVESRVSHLENVDRAQELIDEFMQLSPGETASYREGAIYSGPETAPVAYSLDRFEHAVLCPLRKAALKALQTDSKRIGIK